MKITYVMYLDSIRELALKDIEIINLKKRLDEILTNNENYLYDEILSELGDIYFNLENLKQERDILKNNLLKMSKVKDENVTT